MLEEPVVLEEAVVLEEPVVDEPSAEVEIPENAAPETTIPDDTTPEETTAEDPTPEDAVPEDAAPEDAAPEQATQEDAAWPFGERRSAARQARKPLPAALQEAVAAGAAQDLAQSTSQSGGGHASAPADGPRAKADGPGAATGKKPDADNPGLLRRYGSAIAIVVLFVAAGGVAAGIAAFRGPVNPTGPSTAAQDQAAANAAVLTRSAFPSGWHVSPASSPVGSYGLGSALVTPSVVRNWRVSHPSCSGELNTVSELMTPDFGNVTAVAYTQAATTNPLGGPWRIADAVAFHASAAEVGSGLAAMRSLVDEPKSLQCVAQFWSAALRSQFPNWSGVTMTVGPLAITTLAGTPSLGDEDERHGGRRTQQGPARFPDHLVRRRSRRGLPRCFVRSGSPPQRPRCQAARHLGGQSQAADSPGRLNEPARGAERVVRTSSRTGASCS